MCWIAVVLRITLIMRLISLTHSSHLTSVHKDQIHRGLKLGWEFSIQGFIFHILLVQNKACICSDVHCRLLVLLLYRDLDTQQQCKVHPDKDIFITLINLPPQQDNTCLRARPSALMWDWIYYSSHSYFTCCTREPTGRRAMWMHTNYHIDLSLTVTEADQ